MTDIVDRLRRHAMITEEVGCGSDQGRKIAPVTMREAAAEIERLRKALHRIAYAPEGASGPSLRECIEIARAAFSSTNSKPIEKTEGGA